VKKAPPIDQRPKKERVYGKNSREGLKLVFLETLYYRKQKTHKKSEKIGKIPTKWAYNDEQ